MKRLGKFIRIGVFFMFGLGYANAQNNNVYVPSPMATGDSVVPNDEDYCRYRLKERDVELLFSRDNLPFAAHAADILLPLLEDYDDLFKWEFDETLYLGLISKRNQIANGFSTQFPKNRQINYMGGTIFVDHFASTSWLDTLVFHETAHNYQANVKGNKISRAIHGCCGNGIVVYPIPVSMPNALINSFMLEGNAVLNESWHGTGGRLYNGSLKAMTLLQAKAGNITPQAMYNVKAEFPYTDGIWYHIGGFYNYFLAEEYGLEKVNHFFFSHSRYAWWPFFTNSSMKKSVGTNFETSLKAFAHTYAETANNLVQAEGVHLLSSQTFSPMSGNRDQIFFTINETGRRGYELVVVNKSDKNIEKERGGWPAGLGKVLKIDGEYYVQGGHNTSTTQIRQGLFDKNAFVMEKTAGKLVQGYLSDGRMVYFDVPSSFDQPQLFVGGEFYAMTNSSVVIDEDDNLYYFKNKGKERILYKNRTALTSFKGFFGIVADVDSHGAVYFIANSELGATLYRYHGGEITRASCADNIYDARLINDNEVLLAAVSDKDYYYVINDLTSISQPPHETKLFFESKEYYGPYETTKGILHRDETNTSDLYQPLLSMKYSGTDIMVSSGEESASYSLNTRFADPLAQNSANLFFSRDGAKVAIAGVGYENKQYIIQYALRGYGVVDEDDRDDVRNGGVIASLNVPLYSAGYYDVSLGSTFFQDYDTLEREPLSTFISMGRNEIYGYSRLTNYAHNLAAYGVKERKDAIFGARYDFSHDLPYELYLGAAGKYSHTDADISNSEAQEKTRGVKLTNIAYADVGGVRLSTTALAQDADISALFMPTIDDDLYLKSAGYLEAHATKIFNISSYWFTFPVSLQRTAVYSKYRYYHIEFFGTKSEKETVGEFNFGMQFDLVLFNKFAPVPISVDYYFNDNKRLTSEEQQIRVTIGLSF